MLQISSFPLVLAAEEDNILSEYYPYQNNKILLNTRAYYQNMLQTDLKALKSDQQFKLSCGEVELLPFV